MAEQGEQAGCSCPRVSPARSSRRQYRSAAAARDALSALADRNRGVVLTVIDLFGVERCMFGSNFPVDSLCASFDEIYDGFDAITADFSINDRLRLFYDNAVRIYAIPQAWLLHAG